MKNKCISCTILLVLPMILWTNPVFSKNITGIPQTILSAFQKEYPNAVIKDTDKEIKNGKVYYEIESMDGKISRDILYNSDGSIAEKEEGIQVADLPETVKDSLAKFYRYSKIQKAEKLTRGDTVEYEINLRTGNVRRELQFAPDGRLLTRSVKEKKKP